MSFLLHSITSNQSAFLAMISCSLSLLSEHSTSSLAERSASLVSERLASLLSFSLVAYNFYHFAILFSLVSPVVTLMIKIIILPILRKKRAPK